MEFQLTEAIPILERTPVMLRQLLDGLSEDWIMQNEGGETWSPFDIVGHYIEGEKNDWIVRMKIMLNDAGDKHFHPFDRFAQFEESKGKTITQLLDEFASLRQKNLAVLKAAALTEADLDKTGIHPKFGTVTLRQLLSTWVVHDLAHLNQLTRVMAQQYKEMTGPWKEYISIINNG